MSETIATKIAGIFKYPEAKAPMKLMAAGSEIFAELEPTNAYDPNAIALYLKWMETSNTGGSIDNAPTVEAVEVKVKCGYIPKDHAARLKGKKIISVKRGLAFDSITVEFE